MDGSQRCLVVRSVVCGQGRERVQHESAMCWMCDRMFLSPGKQCGNGAVQHTPRSGPLSSVCQPASLIYDNSTKRFQATPSMQNRRRLKVTTLIWELLPNRGGFSCTGYRKATVRYIRALLVNNSGALFCTKEGEGAEGHALFVGCRSF